MEDNPAFRMSAVLIQLRFLNDDKMTGTIL